MKAQKAVTINITSSLSMAIYEFLRGDYACKVTIICKLVTTHRRKMSKNYRDLRYQMAN